MEPETTRSPRQPRSDATSRRRAASLVLGSVGLASLFGSGIAAVVFPGAIVPLMAIMATAVVFLIVAFSLARGGVFRRPQGPLR